MPSHHTPAPGPRTLQVALNGDSSHPAMPRAAAEIASDAAACVTAGANLPHLHAFDDDGEETLVERPVARAIEAVRAPSRPAHRQRHEYRVDASGKRSDVDAAGAGAEHPRA